MLHQLNDVTFLPEPTTGRALCDAIETMNIDQLRKIDPAIKDDEISLFVQLRLPQMYADAVVQNGKEPEWMALLPKPIQVNIRTHLPWRKEASSYWQIGHNLYLHVNLPRAGIRFAIQEGGIVQDFMSAFTIGRLHHVHQLGVLVPPNFRAENTFYLENPFSHGRLTHLAATGALGMLACENLPIDNDLKTLVIVACLLHDGLTPALGDTMMGLNTGLSEEDQLEELFEPHAGPSFKKEKPQKVCERYGISKKDLFDAILGKKLAGKLVNIFDRLCYSAMDTGAIELTLQMEPDPEFDSIKHILEKNPTPCDLWDSIRLSDEDEPYFEDIDRLETFLRLRALMCKHVYLNPLSRSDMFVRVRVIARALLETGHISRDSLIRGRYSTDWEMLNLISDLSQNHLPDDQFTRHRHHEVFASLNEAKKTRTRTHSRGPPIRRHRLFTQRFQNLNVASCKIGRYHRPLFASTTRGRR